MKLASIKLAVAMVLLTFAVSLAGCAGLASKGTRDLRPSAPSVSAQPVSQSVTVGQTATFTVLATSTATLSYQWRKNGASISGAISSSYTTPPTTTIDNGAKFQVVITNSAGSVTSSAATLTVTPTVTLQSIAVAPSNSSVSQSQTQQFTATGTYSDNTTKDITTSVSWASSNTAVASIGVNTGLATGISAGTSQITASLGSISSPNDILTIVKGISLQSIAVAPSNPSVSQSQTQQFTATGTYSDGSTKNITTTVTWTSSNTAVATIGVNTGLATGLSAGTSQITASLGSISSPNDTLTIVKGISLQSIAVAPSNPSVSQSQTQQFTATGTYSDGSTKNITTTVTWTSSNAAVATIGANTGLAIGISAGTSQVTASLGGITSSSDNLTVLKSITLQSIAVAPSNPSVSQSQTQQFTATGTYSDGSTKNITTSCHLGLL